MRHGSAVYFSAAVPHQGGSDHVNEPWPSFWAELFRRRAWEAVGCIRPAVWDRPDVAWWCAQNGILYVDSSRLERDDPLRRAKAAAGDRATRPGASRKYLQTADTTRLRATDLVWLAANWVKARGSDGKRVETRCRRLGVSRGGPGESAVPVADSGQCSSRSRSS